MRSPRLRIAPKFFLLLATVLPAIAALALIGVRGLADLESDVGHLYGDHITRTHVTARVASDLHRAAAIALELLAANEAPRERRLDQELTLTVIPRLQAEIDDLARRYAHDTAPERHDVAFIARRWHAFLALHASDRLLTAGYTRAIARRKEALVRELDGIFATAGATASRMAARETSEAATAARSAARTYRRSRALIVEMTTAILIFVAAVVLLLIRNVVPRVRDYSTFAARVARGELGERLEPKGGDELTDLGKTLNHLVDRREAERGYEGAQAELSRGLQVTEGQEEAHELLKRHLERSIGDSSVVVFNRNNSADRLTATTAVPADSELEAALSDARPGSCMAVRLGASHESRPGEEPLLECELCGGTATRSICEPLLVGGEVIGSVLVQHAGPLASEEASQVKSSVALAAPVLANLRNLAIAEVRAATDALTGLPNRRSAEDTLKRMVAQASRTVTPLSAILLDLDHFKKVNDVFGHERGDEVLAAVGSVLEASIRESDFAARNGGEEFVILLPSTDAEGAGTLAEKIRRAIAGIEIPHLERPVTASLGVAVMPDHATGGAMLIRLADRALYAAKAKGRNRVVMFDPRSGESAPEPGAGESGANGAGNDPVEGMHGLRY